MNGNLVVLLLGMLSVVGYPAVSADTLDHFPNYRVQGGTPTFKNSILEQIQYPPHARGKGAMGTSLVSLTISPAGKIADFEIITSLGEDYDEELKRVIPLTEEHWLPDSLEKNDLTFIVAFTFVVDGYTFLRNAAMKKIVTCEIPVIDYYGNVGNIRDDQYHIEQANRFYQEKRFNKALDHLDELIRRDPFNRELYLMRGFSRLNLNQKRAACRDFQLIKTLLHRSIPAAVETLCR